MSCPYFGCDYIEVIFHYHRATGGARIMRITGLSIPLSIVLNFYCELLMFKIQRAQR